MIEHNIYNQHWVFIGSFFSSKRYCTPNYCRVINKKEIVTLLKLDGDLIQNSKFFYIKPMGY